MSDKKVELSQDQFDALMNRLNKLESAKTETIQGNHNPEVNQFGRVGGVMNKYSVDPSDYEDPRKALMDSPELQRFAFKENYFIKWDVHQMQYETKWGTNVGEPRFELKLYKRLFEDDGTPTPQLDSDGKPMFDEQGNPMYRSYLVQRGYFFEDPAASVAEARALGLPITDANSKEFLSKMRHLRYKNWLLEVFQPKKPTTSRKTENMLVGSTQVQVESYSEIV